MSRFCQCFTFPGPLKKVSFQYKLSIFHDYQEKMKGKYENKDHDNDNDDKDDDKGNGHCCSASPQRSQEALRRGTRD